MASDMRGSKVIRTPDQRLRVFVSSTLGELAPERVSVRSAVEQLHLIPVMFELGARPHPPAKLYRAYLEQSHLFVGVYWERYGWVAPGETISGLEDEFVLSDGMPRLLYIKEPAPEREVRLTELLGRFAEKSDASYRRFGTLDELADLVEADLAILLSERFEAGGDRSIGGGQTARSEPPALPVPLMPTVGRESAIESVVGLIRSGTRLVTITGTGGVGKTRVASDVARAVKGEFDDVRLVRVGDVVDPSLVTATIAAAIGAPVELKQPAVDAVVAGIGQDRVLLMLDNLEQVVSAGLELSSLLDRCPGLFLLITSRHVMRLHGEHEFPLAPLGVPEPGAVDELGSASAVALYVEYATAVQPSFHLDATNAPAVAELCRRLDGLPLAIELAAAQTRLLSPEAILHRLGDRIDLLAGGSVDLPDRQRTIRSTLDWSHRLLNSNERALFARLAVFTGGASLDAVEAVCGVDSVDDVLETLASLLEKSLIVTVQDPGGDPRVAMLHTVRAYAWEQLQSTDDFASIRDRHANWFQELVISCDPAYHSGAIARWAELDRELPNVRAAIEWRTDRDDNAAIGLFAASLWVWYWLAGRMSEGRAWIDTLRPRLDRADVLADDSVAGCFAEAIGALRFSLGDHVGAGVVLRRALVHYTAADDDEGMMIVSCLLAAMVPVDGDTVEAIEFASAAVARARALDLDWGLAFALGVLGSTVRWYESPERGQAFQLEGLEIARRVGDWFLIGHMLSRLAIGALSEGDLDDARRFLVEASDCCRVTLQMESTVFCLEVAAALAFAEGRSLEAVRFVGCGDSLRERLDIPVWPALEARRAEVVAALVESVSPEEYLTAFAEGGSADPLVLLPS
jgi:predicted ATPase